MKCKYCGKEMSLNDVDYNFVGNKDNYWICDNCNARAIQMIRYGKSIKVEFIEDDKMEENKMSEKTNVVTVGVKGIVMFPKYEEGVQKYAIKINDETAAALDNLVRKQFGAMSLTYGEDEETGEKLLNVKSQFDVPAYDSNTGAPFTEKINHGAEVVASIVVKEYEYKRRHGVTAYLKALVVYKNGESKSSGTDFKSIMGNVL